MVVKRGKSRSSAFSPFCFMFFNPLPDKRVLDWSKLKAFADDKIIVTSYQTFFLEWEKMMVSSIFSPFSTMFSRGFFFRVVKSRACVRKS